MLLSLILPVYLRSKSLKKFLRKMVHQTKNDYELVFVIDTNLENVVEIIESYEKDIKGKIKYIFNSNRCGRNNALATAVSEIDSKYSIFISYSDVINYEFIEDSLAILEKQNADIVEFNPWISDPINYYGKARKKFPTPTLISENQDIICYTYPFDFNKFFKTELLKKVVFKPLSLRVNSRFSIEIIYKCLFFAKDYVFVDKSLVTSCSELSTNFNPLKIMRQWKSLQEFAVQNGFSHYVKEIEYSKFFHEQVFILGFVYASRNKKMIEKITKYFTKQLEIEFKLFVSTNPYILLKNHEAPLLKESLAKNKQTKLYKVIEYETKK